MINFNVFYLIPPCSLTFTHDSHFLVTCDTDGLVIFWGKKDGNNRRIPKFEAFIGATSDGK